MKQLSKIYYYSKTDPSPIIPLYTIKQYHTVYSNTKLLMHGLKVIIMLNNNSLYNNKPFR